MMKLQKLLICILAELLIVSYTVESQPGRGSLRLFDNGQTSISLTSGIVQIYYNSTWQSMCDVSDINDDTANTICRQLGYFTGTQISNSGFGDSGKLFAISDLDCDSGDLTVLQCSFLSPSSSKCADSSNSVAVKCDTDSTFFNFAGNVRLVGQSDYAGSGRIEVYCNNQWGLVCNSGFTQNDANTVCRQLGYTTADSYGPNYGTGNMSQPIWFDDSLNCNSEERCIANCQSCPSTPSSSGCSVNNVAGVTCSYQSNTDYSGTYGYCLFSDVINSLAKLIGIIAGVVIGLIVCVVVVVLVAICCCCCLGVGIGAACCRRKTYTTMN